MDTRIKYNFTPEEELDIATRYSSGGISQGKLRAEYNCSLEKIKRILKKHGARKPPGKNLPKRKGKPTAFTEEEEKEIIHKYTVEDKSSVTIGKEMGRTYGSIIYVLQRHQIPRRKSTGGSMKNCFYATPRKFRQKEDHPNWKGGSTINGQGYRTILNPKRDEPKERQYVLEHRYVMEQHLNRKLLEYEHVHHINGIKTDNRLENLVVKTSTDHYGSVTCPHCLTHFRIR